MDSQLADDESTLNKTWTESFEEAIPFFLNVGMTYDEFWEGDCRMTRAYLRAWKLKEEKRQSDIDLQAWLIGQYVMDAIGATFAKGKYPRKPRTWEKKEYEDETISEEKRAEMWLNSFFAHHKDLPPTE